MPKLPLPKSAADAQLASALRTMREHVVRCAKCRTAIDGSDPTDMCRDGMACVLGVFKCDHTLWVIKQAAYVHQNGTVYACPAPWIHGEANAITAAPLVVTGVQEGLF